MSKASPRTNSAPPAWSIASSEEVSSKRPKILTVGLILIVILAIGIVGLLVYPYFHRQQDLQAAKNREQDAAKQAVYQLQLTCFSITVDETHLTNSTRYQWPGYAYSYSGYMITYETFGVYNPSRFAMNTTWALSYEFPLSDGTFFNDTSFPLTPNGTARIKPSFLVNATNLPGNQPTDLSNYLIVLQGAYTVNGTLDTYSISTRDQMGTSIYDSMRPPGIGILGNLGTLSKC